jgi:hypothetical protein
MSIVFLVDHRRNRGSQCRWTVQARTADMDGQTFAYLAMDETARTMKAAYSTNAVRKDGRCFPHTAWLLPKQFLPPFLDGEPSAVETNRYHRLLHRLHGRLHRLRLHRLRFHRLHGNLHRLLVHRIHGGLHRLRRTDGREMVAQGLTTNDLWAAYFTYLLTFLLTYLLTRACCYLLSLNLLSYLLNLLLTFLFT